MSKVKIGINGFGRIGRQVLKALYEQHHDVAEVVAESLGVPSKSGAASAPPAERISFLPLEGVTSSTMISQRFSVCLACTWARARPLGPSISQ